MLNKHSCKGCKIVLSTGVFTVEEVVHDRGCLFYKPKKRTRRVPVLTFEVQRFGPGATSLKDLNGFIAEHESDKDDLIVEIDPAGIGDAFADNLKHAGFTVKRVSA